MKRVVTCYSCGRKTEYAPCSDKEASPEEARCNVLSGWLTVTHWKGIGHTVQLDFCSFDCLIEWAKDQAPQIPKSVLDAFQAD